MLKEVTKTTKTNFLACDLCGDIFDKHNNPLVNVKNPSKLSGNSFILHRKCIYNLIKNSI